MWWLFSNNKKEKITLHNFHLFNKVRYIEDNLKNSFFNIKKDISKINNYIYHHNDSILHLKKRIEHLENLFEELKESKNPENLIKELPKIEGFLQEKDEKKKSFLVKWEDLTNIQQNIFLRLGLLQIESSQRRIAMKHLSEELYPDKEYNDVRSMISDYINLLNEYGLIKKTRKGRQIFVSITEKGTVFYDKNKRKKLLSIINR